MTYFEGQFQALAHRGFAHASVGTEGLENSLAAFGAAVDLGYRYVETDAHGTADGVAVALHDESLDRTTDGTGLVAELPWSEVGEARIGGVEPVPMLEEVLGGWPELHVNIDVKHDSGVGPVARAIERTSAWDRVCVTSFDAARRRAALAELSQPVATSAGRREIATFLSGVRTRLQFVARRALRDVDALQVPVGEGRVTVVDDVTVEAAHLLGKKVHVWTVNDADEMHRLIDQDVDGLITDRADLLKEVLIERRLWT